VNTNTTFKDSLVVRRHRSAMDDSTSTKSPKTKDSSQLEEGIEPSGAAPRILFAPDVIERRRQRSEEFPATLTLSRTLSRQRRFSSYSTASDEEAARLKRVATRTIEPQTRLPTGFSSFNHPR